MCAQKLQKAFHDVNAGALGKTYSNYDDFVCTS